eukprot:14001970-Ditylum_brightwellii.AAC.1
MLALHNVKKAIAIGKAYLKNREFLSGTGLNELLLHVYQEIYRLENNTHDIGGEKVLNTKESGGRSGEMPHN